MPSSATGPFVLWVSTSWWDISGAEAVMDWPGQLLTPEGDRGWIIRDGFHDRRPATQCRNILHGNCLIRQRSRRFCWSTDQSAAGEFYGA